jgi:hypothetical protein
MRFIVIASVARACKAGSSNELQMATVVTEPTVVYETGARTRELRDQGGKPSGHDEGCLTDEQLARIRKELDRSPWKVSKGMAGVALESPPQ